MKTLPKRLLSGLFLMLLIGLYACDENNNCVTGNRDVVSEEITGLSDFRNISLSGAGELQIERGDLFSVSVTGESNIIDLHEFRVSNETLIIELRDGINCVDPREPFEIFVTMPVLEEAVLAGSGNIFSEDAFEGNQCLAEVIGSGNINLNFVVEEAALEVIGSGNITMTGSVTDLEVLIAGSGNVAAFAFPSQFCSVTISGSGNCEVEVEQELGVVISGSGNVRYRGNPVINSQISGSGTVINAN